MKNEQSKRTNNDGSTDDGEKNNGKKYAIIAGTRHPSRQVWFVDSGASYHMTPNLVWLKNYQELQSKIPIRVGNNEVIFAVGKGTVEVIANVDGTSKKVSIRDVMYVPDISDNLFSTGVADARGIRTQTANGLMELIIDDEIVMVGRKAKDSNMYVLDVQVPCYAFVSKAERSIDEWHRALGHPGVDAIKTLQRCDSQGFKLIENTMTNEGCSACPPGRAHQVSHPEQRKFWNVFMLT